jgi:thioredoxin-like negative regulator of GroEL
MMLLQILIINFPIVSSFVRQQQQQPSSPCFSNNGWITILQTATTTFSINGNSRITTATKTTTTATSTATGLYSVIKFKNFDHVLDTSHQETLLIYFETSKCGPCRLMKKELVTAKRLVGNKDLKIFSLDTTRWPDLATRYNIRRLPCILFVKGGKIHARLEGVTKGEDIAKEYNGLESTT